MDSVNTPEQIMAILQILTLFRPKSWFSEDDRHNYDIQQQMMINA